MSDEQTPVEPEPTDSNVNGTLLDDPNREAVGLEPAWVEGTGGTGGGDPDGLPDEVEPVSEESETFDPGEHTIAEVEDYVNANPDERDDVLDAELAGKNRSTLVGWLES